MGKARDQDPINRVCRSAVSLWRAAGCPEPRFWVNPFTDVKYTDYFYKAVLWAVKTASPKALLPKILSCFSLHPWAGGTPPYSYQWSLSYDNGICWNKLNTRTDREPVWKFGALDDLSFRCTVTDAKGASVTSTPGYIRVAE